MTMATLEDQPEIHVLCWTNQSSPINTLWPSDPIWCQRSWSSLVQVMVCCLMAPLAINWTNVDLYSGHTTSRSTASLLMPWLLASPGHQQPCYWLHIKWDRKDLSSLCHLSVEKCKCILCPPRRIRPVQGSRGMPSLFLEHLTHEVDCLHVVSAHHLLQVAEIQTINAAFL